MSSTERRAKIEEWLRAIGCTPTVIEDPTTHWHLQVNYPAGKPHIMHVVCPKDRPAAVVIASKVDLTPELLENFTALDQDAKEEFIWDLRMVMTVPETEFQMEGVSGQHDCPKGIQFSATRFDDGLTLDSFAHSVGAVFKTELKAIWTIQRHLSAKGYGSGDRFDFRRLGM